MLMTLLEEDYKRLMRTLIVDFYFSDSNYEGEVSMVQLRSCLTFFRYRQLLGIRTIELSDAANQTGSKSKTAALADSSVSDQECRASCVTFSRSESRTSLHPPPSPTSHHAIKLVD